MIHVNDKKEWATSGACVGHDDPDLWYGTTVETITAAKQICDGCPVKILCRNDAVRNGETDGMWGGMLDAAQGRVMRRHRQGLPPDHGRFMTRAETEAVTDRVMELREQGLGFKAIGERLGMSRSAARNRWGRRMFGPTFSRSMRELGVSA
jgi:WhiB family redox-sensing transcriptional regulator